MIVGIFTTWDWSLFEPPENVLKRKLDENPTFPLTEIRPNVYMLTVKPKRLIMAIAFCVTCGLIMGLMYGLAGAINEYFPLCLVIFIGFLQTAVYYRQSRTFVLDANERFYEFYKDDELIYRGHFHNIYIRLKGDKTGSGEIYYSVVLNGFHIDEESITGWSKHHRKLFKLGRRLAHRLDLNFFDFEDVSRNHVIRNQCPYLGTDSLTDIACNPQML